MAHYKICCLGSDGVGKTALIIQLICDHFVDEYHFSFSEEFYSKQICIDDESGLLEILDTINHEDFQTLRDNWIEDSDGFIIIYSITSRSSFSQVSAFTEQVRRVTKRDRLAMVLVGNKCDLEINREVSYQEGHDLARSFGSTFKETSAKTCVNVQDAFFDLVRMMRSYPHPTPPPRRSSHRIKTFCVLL